MAAGAQRFSWNGITSTGTRAPDGDYTLEIPSASLTDVDGIDYVFIDDAEFDRLIADGDLLEWAEVHGAARYGTISGSSAAAVRRASNSSSDSSVLICASTGIVSASKLGGDFAPPRGSRWPACASRRSPMSRTATTCSSTC